MAWQTLIGAGEATPETLQSMVVLDCRAALDDPKAGRRAWCDAHLPGALHADLDRDLAAPVRADGRGGRHPLPDAERLRERAGRWGIGADTQVVVYDDVGGAFAARAWWCLRWLGHAAVAVLDGGLAAWTDRHGAAALERGEREAPGGAALPPRAPLTRTVVAAEIAAGAGPLIDARARPRFDGEVEPIDPVAGHIPGALCLPHAGNLGPDGHFLSREDLAARFADIGEDPICYCGSGVTAAHNVLALRHAGRREPRLYVGSWSDWISDPSRPRAPA
ncbi:MAG: sulfurtransferase [Pseudomonadota bacterium]